MKNKYTIAGIIFTFLGLAIIAVAFTNPQLSFSWPNWVTYTLYGLYTIYTILIFCMPRIKNASFVGCIILAFEFIALGLIVISVGVRNTTNNNWYLPVGICISALLQFAIFCVIKKRKKNNK